MYRYFCRVDVEILTPALKIWRDAVLSAQSAAQLSMCISMLYDCVAWEKSIMKVVSVHSPLCKINATFDNKPLQYIKTGYLHKTAIKAYRRLT